MFTAKKYLQAKNIRNKIKIHTICRNFKCLQNISKHAYAFQQKQQSYAALHLSEEQIFTLVLYFILRYTFYKYLRPFKNICIQKYYIAIELINTFFIYRKVTFFMKFVGLRNTNWLVVGVEADCLTRDPGLYVECRPWGSF